MRINEGEGRAGAPGLIVRNLVRYLEGMQQPTSYQVAELGLVASH